MVACAVQAYVHIVHQATRALLGAETPNKPTTQGGRPKPEIAKPSDTGTTKPDSMRDSLSLWGSNAKHTKAGLAAETRVDGLRFPADAGGQKVKTDT